MRCRMCSVKSPKKRGQQQHEIGGHDVPHRLYKHFGRICPECLRTAQTHFGEHRMVTATESLMDILEDEFPTRTWDKLYRVAREYPCNELNQRIIKYCEGRNGTGIEAKRLYSRENADGNFEYQKGLTGRFENEGLAGNSG